MRADEFSLLSPPLSPEIFIFSSLATMLPQSLDLHDFMIVTGEADMDVAQTVIAHADNDLETAIRNYYLDRNHRQPRQTPSPTSGPSCSTHEHALQTIIQQAKRNVQNTLDSLDSLTRKCRTNPRKVRVIFWKVSAPAPPPPSFTHAIHTLITIQTRDHRFSPLFHQ